MTCRTLVSCLLYKSVPNCLSFPCQRLQSHDDIVKFLFKSPFTSHYSFRSVFIPALTAYRCCLYVAMLRRCVSKCIRHAVRFGTYVVE